MSDERPALEARAQALLELEARAQKFPLYYYEPNSEKTERFHASSKRVRILSGGNRSGKSEANVAESAAYALGYRPWVLRQMGLPPPEKPWLRPDSCPEAALCKNGLGIRVQIPNQIFMVTGQSMKKGIGETLYPKIQKLLGPFIADEHMAHSGVPADIILKNGSKLVFGSAEQGNQSFESTNYTFNSIDEPVPRRVYTGIARGAIDQYAPIVMTFTPIGNWAGWIFKDLYAPAVRGNHPSIDVVQMSIYDNKFLPREAIEAFANDPAVSDIEREARLYGRFMHLSDCIYSNFNEEVHVVPDFFVPRDWYIGCSVDPHTIRPWAIIYFAVAPTGDVYVFKEWPTADFTRIRKDPRSIEEYALLLRRLDADLNIQLRLMDPNYGPRKDTIRGLEIPSIVSDISRFGLYFHHRINDDLAYGEAKVRSLLHYDTARPLDSYNRPRIFFTESCGNCIQSMRLYTSKAKLNSELELDDAKRDETYKDFADVVRYMAVSLVANSAPQDFVDRTLSLYSNNDDYMPAGYGEQL